MMTASRSRVRIAAGVALVAALAVAAVLLLTQGAGGSDAGKLAWKGKVQVFQSGVPTDRILYTQLENVSLRDVDLDTQNVELFDEDGKKVRSATIFLAAFAHGIFPYDTDVSDFEKRRLGKIATLKPGQAVPVTMSWSVPKGAKPPVRADFGAADIAVPGDQAPLPAPGA
jgi:hypothetical protein